MLRCDIQFPVSDKCTYVSESLKCTSTIDYFLTSNTQSTIAFNVLDVDVNLSDHRPIMAVCLCKASSKSVQGENKTDDFVRYFRWAVMGN